MDSQASRIIKKRRYRALTREGYFSLFCKTAVMAFLLYVVFTRVFFFAQKEGNDMFPAVKDGDLLLCYCLEESYEKDDIVWYTVDGKEMAGRVVAAGGDVVTITEDGETLVNGTNVDDDVLYQTDPKEELTYPYRVPEDSVFILGDYRTNAADSRDFGAVPVSSIKGKVITVLRRRGL